MTEVLFGSPTELHRSDEWVVVFYAWGKTGVEAGVEAAEVHLYRSTRARQLIHSFADASSAEANMKALGLAQYFQQAPQAVLKMAYVQARSDNVTTLSLEAE